jgi:hypothetical protein
VSRARRRQYLILEAPENRVRLSLRPQMVLQIKSDTLS